MQRTGIHERHIAAPGEVTSDLALARRARRRSPHAKLDAESIDLIVLATSTPDQTFPATRRLGAGRPRHHPRRRLRPAGGLLRLRLCAGDGRRTAADRARYKRALVIGAETFSRILDWNDRTTCVLFGDGAGAVVVEAQEQPGTREDRGILTDALRSDGRHKIKLYVDGGPSSTQTVGHLRMEGREVFRHAVAMITDVVEDAFKATGYTRRRYRLVRPAPGQQAHHRRFARTSSALRPEKIVITVDRHGNTSAASIPLALADAVADRRIKRGDLLLLEAMGGGFTWGAALVRW